MSSPQIPKQLMMKCTVALQRINIDGLHYPSDVEEEELPPVQQENSLLPFHSAPPAQNENDNTRTLTPKQIVLPSPASNSPLPKIKSARALEAQKVPEASSSLSSKLSIIELIQKCHLCKVVLVDCMRGSVMQSYAKGLAQNTIDSDTEIKRNKADRKKKKEKKKHKHKQHKAGVQVRKYFFRRCIF